MAGKHVALVNLSTGKVENMIVADPARDATPHGYRMIASPPAHVTIGTTWDGTNFAPPTPFANVPLKSEPPTVVPGLEMI